MPTALVLEAPRRLETRELPLPVLDDDDGILRVEACGLCGTDHEQFTGALAAPDGQPFVPGHESVGVVEAEGSRAAERWGVSVGDRVAVEVFLSCRSCPACASGSYQRCRQHGLKDMYGFVPVTRPPGLWGGYATHQYLAADSMVVQLPAGLDPVVATLFNPLGAGIRWAVTLPDTQPGAVVAVLGPGIRGLSSLIALREAGAGFVMVTGSGDADEGRLGVAKDLGADLVVDVSRRDPVALLKDATGGLADVIVDVTANAPGALAQAVALARPGGTIVRAGTTGSADTPGFWPDSIVYKELRVMGALGVDTSAYRAACALLASGRYPFADLPREVVGFGDLPGLLGRMAGDPTGDRPVHGVLVP